MIRLTKEFSFEMAHALAGYDGPCREIHGHSYKLIVDRYDHAFVLRETEANQTALTTIRGLFNKIITTPYQPTCENMVEDFARVIAAELPAGVELFSVKLHETATSFAEWYATDNC